MTVHYGLLLERDTAFDLEPFPLVPVGALKAETIFLVENGLQLLNHVRARNVFIVVDVGALYLLEAISKWEFYNEFNFSYTSDVADSPLNMVLENVFALMENTRNKTLAVVPGNVITDLDMAEVERFHRSKRRPPMTLVVSPGVPDRAYDGMPPLYRPTQIALIEPTILPLVNKHPVQSLYELISMLDEQSSINYYTHDGLTFEVDSPEAFGLLHGLVEPKDDGEDV
jgi:NDP-sugar pyrophosphorylase family protein